MSFRRLSGDALKEHLNTENADPIWALEFHVDQSTPTAYVSPVSSVSTDTLREFSAAAVTQDCSHPPDPVWHGVIMNTPWKFMRCPVDTLDDPAITAHPLNVSATEFVRANETKRCPCQWYGNMVFAHRGDRNFGNTVPHPIPVSDVIAALG